MRYLVSAFIAVCLLTGVVVYTRAEAQQTGIFEKIIQLAKTKQYLIYADADNLDVETFRFFATKSHLQTLYEADIKHIFVEMTDTNIEKGDIQVYADAYGNNAGDDKKRSAFVSFVSRAFYQRYLKGYEKALIDRGTNTTEFSRHYAETMADLVAIASVRGITVHLVDTLDLAMETPQFKNFMLSVQRSLPPGTHVMRAIQKSPQLMKRYQAITMRGRMDDNPLSQFIKEKAGNQKAVIYYGVLHGNRDFDLDELLGKDKTATIEVHRSRDSYAAHINSYKICSDFADMIYLVETNQIGRTDPRLKEFAQDNKICKYKSTDPDGLPPL